MRALSVLSSGLLAAAVLVPGCGIEPCRSQGDCPFGTYCVLDITAAGGASGRCVHDCLSAEDCPQATDQSERAICTNEGRCELRARAPRLFVLEPEVDTAFEEGTRRVRVSGEVEAAAGAVTVSVSASTEGTCFGGPKRSVTVENPTPGAFASLPFVLDGVILDPGATRLTVSAAVGSARQSTSVLVEIPCPGCAQIRREAPGHNTTVSGLVVPELTGTIQPYASRALWRVHSSAGDVFDGTLSVGLGGRFEVSRLPLFAGTNRLEVVVSGVGTGLGEARCSSTVVSAVTRERGLRAVMSWDGETSDVDVHLVGPGGAFGDPASTLSARSLSPTFGGTVEDDFDGLGPEVLQLESMADGVYGVIVEPITDGDDPGSNVFLRLVYDGRALTAGPIGPRYLSARRAEMWVVGAVRVLDGQAELVEVDELSPLSTPPTRAPSDWPTLY